MEGRRHRSGTAAVHERRPRRRAPTSADAVAKFSFSVQYLADSVLVDHGVYPELLVQFESVFNRAGWVKVVVVKISSPFPFPLVSPVSRLLCIYTAAHLL